MQGVEFRRHGQPVRFAVGEHRQLVEGVLAVDGAGGLGGGGALDHEVGDEPAETGLSDCAVDVGGFEQVGDESVDGEAAFELLAEDLEATECFGEGEEAGTETHCHGGGIGFDGFVGNVHGGFSAAED